MSGTLFVRQLPSDVDRAQFNVAVSQGFRPAPGLSREPGQSKPWELRHAYAAYRQTESPLVTSEQLKAVHDPAYVDGVLEKRIPDGYREKNDASLNQIRAAVGAFIVATELALDNMVAFAPVSGFHHAGYDFGGGFCTFNGLLVAAAHVKKHRGVENVLIIDGDAHWGDGTDDILSRNLSTLPYISNLSHSDYGLTPKNWKEKIQDAIEERRWNLIMYQAGADAWIHDTLGSGYLHEEGLRARDALVFFFAVCGRIPVVWNCAGGYNGSDTLRLHQNTMKEMERRYHGISRETLK